MINAKYIKKEIEVEICVDERNHLYCSEAWCDFFDPEGTGCNLYLVGLKDAEKNKLRCVECIENFGV